MAITMMTSCTSDSIDDQTTINVTPSSTDPTPNTDPPTDENGGNTKDKDKDNN